MNFKEKIKPLLHRSGLLRLREMMLSRSVLILGYHSVSENRDGQADFINPGITTRADRFADQMRLLREKYRPTTLEEIAAWIREDRPIPARSIAVSFDDGFEDNYSVAAPILEQFDIRGTMYLTVDCVQKQKIPWFCRIQYLFREAKRRKRILHDEEFDRNWNLDDPADYREAFALYNRSTASLEGENLERRIAEFEERFGFRSETEDSPRMMNFRQARELSERGHAIGNHSLSHGNLARIPEDSLDREIVQAHEILQRELGRSVEHFSYPHPALSPQWNERTLEMTQRLGYRTAVLTRQDRITRRTSPLLLPRIMLSNPDLDQFRWKIDKAFAGFPD